MSGDARIEALEIKCAHLEKGLQELSDVVADQEQRLAQMARANRQLADQLALLGDEAASKAPDDELPPHY